MKDFLLYLVYSSFIFTVIFLVVTCFAFVMLGVQRAS